MPDNFDEVFGGGRGGGLQRDDAVPAPAPEDILDRHCIEVSAHGSTTTMTFDEFAQFEIQDDEVARDTAERMLRSPLDRYPSNEDEPAFYREFTVLDPEALRAQVDAADID